LECPTAYITLLEECDVSVRKERERYWISVTLWAVNLLTPGRGDAEWKALDYQNHKDEYDARNRRYVENHKEQVRNYQAEYRRLNREKLNAYNREYKKAKRLSEA
jgi:hypothetical protein